MNEWMYLRRVKDDKYLKRHAEMISHISVYISTPNKEHIARLFLSDKNWAR